MREIRLGIGNGGPGSGHVALVDDADYELVSQYAWHVFKSRTGNVYAWHAWKDADGEHRRLRMHHLVVGTAGIDHVDGNGLNNQRANLRPADHVQNTRNARKRPGPSSPYKGVTWSRRRSKWYAQIQASGRKRALGFFTDEQDAARAYDAAARELFGAFARVNFPADSEQGARLSLT